MLTPKNIRRDDINSSIGYFMNSPFPMSDVYKMFPRRNEVLLSLLCSNLIGFHSFEWAKSFWHTTHRILGVDHKFTKGGFLSLECFGREVMIRVSHIAIDLSDINETLGINEVPFLQSADQELQVTKQSQY
jgi:trehalose 6-phosphate synthase/phosphatase